MNTDEKELMKGRSTMKVVKSFLVSMAMVCVCAFTFMACSEVQMEMGTDRSYSTPLTAQPPPRPIAPHSSDKRHFGTGATQRRETDRNLPATPGSIPSLDEEVWVIQRPAADAAAHADKDTPGTGAMLARGIEEVDVPIPLQHTDVKATLTSHIASVQVTQQYANPFSSKIEAVYAFPLPQNAAIQGFVMQIGERRIRGIIREREEAERIYAEAKQQGYTASLLTQERPNVFTQAVANIEPGKRIDVEITYFHTLAYDDGWYEWVFPMVVGPRFNPPGHTGGIGAVARGDHGPHQQKTNVTYLKPGERSGHDIGLHVAIDAGVPLGDIQCRSHVVEVQRSANTVAHVRLSERDAIPNKDFVLRYQVAGDDVRSALVTHRDPNSGQGTFLLTVYPPQDLQRLQRRPVELVFVLDCSGSMSGTPLRQAKAAIQRGLKRLQPQDTFQIIRFSESSSKLGSHPVVADRNSVRKAIRTIKGWKGGGGTMMVEGIKAALDFPHDPERLRFVVFLTDGFIGNEQEILSELHDRLDAARVFSFGVGSSPNRYLMDRMAKLGRGVVAYLGKGDSANDVMDRFFERISHPALTHLDLQFDGMQVHDVYPSRLPDLFVGRPVTVLGRFTGQPRGVSISGMAGGKRRTLLVSAGPSHGEGGAPELTAVWARARIADLMDRYAMGELNDARNPIRATALAHNLMSQYTAFVTVDATRRTEGDFGTTVPVPVNMPEGVRYDTTVPR